MQTSHPAPVSRLDAYRPPCSRCGALTWLARIEPAGEPSHDVRTFECPDCGYSQVAEIKLT